MTASDQAGSVVVTSSLTGATASATFSLTIAPGSATKLAFVQQPTSRTAGAVIAPAVTVQVEDSFGNAVHTAGVPVTLQLVPSQILAGTLPIGTDANGLATFSDLSVHQVGQYQLLAMSAGVVSATSNTFNITAGTASSILATGGTPQSAIIQTAYGAPLQAAVADSLGNPLSGVPVVFTAPASGPSGLFGGQSTVTINTDGSGHAAVTLTANSIAGTFAVTASSSAITGSALFNLTNLPAGASSLSFVQQPTNVTSGQPIFPPVTVQVRDGSRNLMQVGGIPIVLSLSNGTGPLLGSVVQLTNESGLATFGDLSIGPVGIKTLRAASGQQAPADSQPFEITAGAAASVAAFSGSPQSTTVLQPFRSELSAQVTDALGNPVSGVSVTFTLPSGSGPNGTFGGATTVQTNANGIAPAPTLTANGTPGNFVVTATATGVSSPAVFTLTNLPQQSSPIVATPSTLAFGSGINQPAPPGQTVQITAVAGVGWTASPSASWLSALPASGAGNGQITVSVNPAGLAPGTYTGSVGVTGSTGGSTLVLVTYTITQAPALVITPPTLVFTTTSSTITPAAQTLQATSTSRLISYSVSAQVSTPSGGNWLQVTPSQGQTAGTVTVSVNPAGLSQGIYSGSVLFKPVDTTANSVAAPVTLIVGCQQGGCTVEPNIISVVNGASFQPGSAPGEIMTIFGTNLSDAVYQAPSYPLPNTLGPTSVSVNGIPAPLFYASPTQIDFQMPSGLPTGGVSVAVNNGTLARQYELKASEPHISPLVPVAPGLFETAGNRAAALNGDLTPNSPATPIPAGGYVILYITGQGSVTPPVADGTAAPASPLSIINAPVEVTIGGMSAQVAFQGLAPGFAGLGQLNVIVPSGLTAGDQPVFIAIHGSPSNAGLITVK
jgi:adhesin/invasin